MISERANRRFAVAKYFLAVIFMLPFFAGTVCGQVTASITGTVKDASGADVAGATITVKHVDTGVTRTAQTDASGNFVVTSLPVGQYELDAEKSGFKREVRQGITLVVAQQAVVNVTLEVGNVEQAVTVTAEAPLVNTTPTSTSGLVTEEQVKDLPLNGRSFDQLLTLNAGTSNYSSHTVNNGFSVVGRRPEENRFLVNGVDYFSMLANGNTDSPYGASKELLGVDAVREFNVVQHTYGAEYGKRAGGQVAIVSSSGTNQLHGSLFEFVRNSMFDARNFFDHPVGERIPPFRRNQFGGALGGPIKKDKMFVFGNYEGFRQRLGISDLAIVPDNNLRAGILPPSAPAGSVVARGMIPFVDDFWPAPNGPNLLTSSGALTGEAEDFANPVQSIREDFGLVQFDYDISAKDTFTTNYLIDDGVNDLPQADPLFISIAPIRSQVLSLHETHIFSTNLLNTALVGFSRSATASGTLPFNTTIPANLSFVAGLPPGTITVGGGGPGSGASSLAVAGGFQSVPNIKNLYTAEDDVHYLKGNHSFSFGVWYQHVQYNAGGATASKAGSVTFPSVATLLTDAPTQLVAYQTFTEEYFRTNEFAWYAQDEIKLRPNLTVRIGLRDEATTGWNEAKDRCTNYQYSATGVINTNPTVGSSCLTENNAKSLWQPRVGLAWDPTGSGKWAVRAGFAISNDLQDGMGARISGNPPFNSQVTYTAPILNVIPIPISSTPPVSCSATQTTNCSIFAPGGIEPTMHTPTVQEWSLTIERQLMSNLSLQIGYVGSQSYHLEDSVDANEASPLLCQTASGCVSGGTTAAGAPQTSPVLAPVGSLYLPPGTRPNPFVAQTFSWFYGGVSSYHALNATMIKRTTSGLTFKVNYTYSKIIDLNSTPDPSAGNNQPSHLVSITDLALSRGVASYNLTNQFNANFSYELPFGQGKHWGNGAHGVVNQLIGGWQWNGIVTAQSGFPFTPLAGSNRSGTGDTGNPDSANINPAFSGPVILGSPTGWFNPQAFTLPILGTFGNVSRGKYLGPGLTEFDTSFFKKFTINERFALQFRTEFFNIANHANFGSPSPLVFSGTTVNPSAGVITATATTSRQIQFALKLMF